MKTGGRYKVVGPRSYRGHEPGSVFEAVLERQAEIRAINRGSIQLLARVDVGLKPENARLPVQLAKRKTTRKKKGSE